MGRTYRKIDKKFKDRLKKQRQNRNKRSIHIEPKENDETRKNRNFFSDGLYD